MELAVVTECEGLVEVAALHGAAEDKLVAEI